MAVRIREFIQRISLIPEILLCGAFFYLVWVKCGLWFETNDDLVINDLLRGAVTGEPEYHTIYNSVILTAPLSLLYRIAPSIPWWGGFLLLCNGFSVVVTLDAIVKKGKDFFELITFPIAFAICLLPTWYMRGRIQYTSTAMLLAIAGIVALVLYKDYANLWVFGICEFLAYIIRPEAMEIVLPIGFGILLVALATRGENLFLEFTKHAIPVFIVLGILALGFVVKLIAYGGSDWTASKEFEEGRQEMFDYSGITEFDDINEIYKRGVTKEEYNAFAHALVLDYENLAETVSAASYVSKANATKPKILDVLKRVYLDSYLKLDTGFGKPLYVLAAGWILLLITSVVYGRISGFIGFGIIYLITKGVTWGYIYIRGRMPLRIMLPLYFLELTALIVVSILLTNEETNKSRKLRYITIPIILCLGYVSFLSGREQLQITTKQCESLPILREMESEISDYCKERSDHKFLLSTYIYSNYRRSVLDVGEKNPPYIYAGGWQASLPSVKARNSEYLKLGYIYLITTSESINGNVEAETAFLNQRYDGKVKKEDSIDLATGGQAIVYRVR